jgi:hypothetical protein
MYREIEKSQAVSLAKSVEMKFVVKAGWEGAVTNLWSSIPCHLIGVLGFEQQLLFSCYHSSYDGNMDITNLEPSEWLNKQEKGLIDFYLKMAIETILKHAKTNITNRLLISTEISSAFEHFVDLGFVILPKNPYSSFSVQGYINLRR